MAAPSTVFLDIPLATAAAAIDTVAERKAFVGTTISTGISNAWNFGTVNISDGAADSGVKTLFWKVTAANGNTTVDNFKFWLSQNGFDQAGSVMKYLPITCESGGTITNNDDNYEANALVGTYSGWLTTPEAEPGAQNVFCANDATSIDITGVTVNNYSDVVCVVGYFAIADNETTGTYWGRDPEDNPGYSLRCAFKYDFS